MLFEPFRIKNVEFANRVLRSSIGGRIAYYDGAVSPAWIHFEKAFAAGRACCPLFTRAALQNKRPPAPAPPPPTPHPLLRPGPPPARRPHARPHAHHIV